MRYYRIEITDANGKPIVLNSFGGDASGGIGSGSNTEPGVITSLLRNGLTNPAALQIELDIAQYPYHQAGDTKSYVRIYGLGLPDISSALYLNAADWGDLNNTAKRIVVKGGMAKGYPLVDPNQQGILAQGIIYQAFGNWVGTDMTLDLVLSHDGAAGSVNSPSNFSFTWAKGELLADLIVRVISQAIPKAKVNVDKVSLQRVAPQDYSGTYDTLTQFADWLVENTKGQLSHDDPGVRVSLSGLTARAAEGKPANQPSGGNGASGQETTQSKPKEIRYQDLVGQVTWIEPNSITAKMVMRGDLDIGTYIRFPKNMPTITTGGAMPGAGTGGRTVADMGTFPNQVFQIQQIQHWGNYRQPDATSWCTTIWATNLAPVAAADEHLPVAGDPRNP